MCLTKLSEIKIYFLFSKIIIWSEKLNDNKCITFYLSYYFIHKTCL